MILITDSPLSPQDVIEKTKTDGSGCVVVYTGLIRDVSLGKQVASVEYRDPDGTAARNLEDIAGEVRERWEVEAVSIAHRTGVLKVGDINLVVAVASAHRTEGFAACAYIIDRFKEKLPTSKKETYKDGSTWTG